MIFSTTIKNYFNNFLNYLPSLALHLLLIRNRQSKALFCYSELILLSKHRQNLINSKFHQGALNIVSTIEIILAI